MSSQQENAQTTSDFSDLVDSNDVSIVSLKRFMNQYELAYDDHATHSNIICVDYQYKKRFFVPEAGISQMMAYLLNCYNERITMHFMEVQPESDAYDVGSGLSFDFTFIMETKTIAFEDVISGFLKILFEDNIIKLLRLPKSGREEHHCVLFGSSQPEYIEVLYKYKQLYRIIIPSIQVSRPVKKLIFDRLWNSLALRELFKKKINTSIRSVFNFNSKSVPSCLIGSCSAYDNVSLDLMSIQKVTIEDGESYEGISMIPNPNGFFKNIVYECSINYEMSTQEGGLIKKRVYIPKTGVIKTIEEKKEGLKERMDVAYDKALNEIASLSIYDDTYEQLKTILKMLSDERVEDLEQRNDIIIALASTSIKNKFKCIALWFCRNRCKTMTIDEFEKMWDTAVHKMDIRCNLKSLRYWAGLDSPTEMRRFLEKQVRRMLLRDVKGMISGGSIGHTDIASYLEFMFRNMFATVVVNNKTIWYEFGTPSTKNLEVGQEYKWRPVGSHPVNLSEYISMDFAEIVKKVILELLQEINNTKDEDRKKYLKSLKTKFISSIKQITSMSFKRNVIEATADKFSNPVLIKALDKTPHIMGVGNGVLEFDGSNARLLDHYHSYPISLYSETNYKPYDPNDKYVKIVTKAIKDMFCEEDAYEFLMMYMSTTLDGNTKESIFMILTGGGGNGKTVLIDLLRRTVGEKYVRRMPISFITDQARTKSAAADPAMMELKNARMVYYSESEQNEKANISKIKDLTGQDTVSTRQLYGEQENITPNCNHLLTTNYRLVIESTDWAVWRRFKTYRMKNTFLAKPDPANEYHKQGDQELINTMKHDKRYHEAFLSMLVHFRTRLYRDHEGQILKVPHPTIEYETDLYRQEEDIYERFISQRVFYKKGRHAQSMDEFLTIFRNYYRNENGERLKVKNENLKYIFMNSSIQKFVKFNASGICILEDLYTVEEAAPIIPGSVLYKEYLKNKDQWIDLKELDDTPEDE